MSAVRKTKHDSSCSTTVVGIDSDYGDVEGKGFIRIANNFNSSYVEDNRGIFLTVKNDIGEEIYVVMAPSDMMEIFKGFVEIIDWYKEKGFEVEL